MDRSQNVRASSDGFVRAPRRHVVLAATVAAVASQPAEEDPAQRQQSKRLPERNLRHAEERRQQPIPQQLHELATDEGNEQNPAELPPER